MYNDCTFIGNLGKDPESRTSGKGETFATFSIAVNKPGAARDDKPLWVNVTAFKTSADAVLKYLKAGNRVLVQGAIELQEYEGKDGKNHQSLKLIANKVVFLTPKDADATASAPKAVSVGATATAAASPITDEDIPF